MARYILDTHIPEHELKTLLRDALHDFRGHRIDVDHYIATRYKDINSEAWLERKTKEVEKRLSQALELTYHISNMEAYDPCRMCQYKKHDCEQPCDTRYKDCRFNPSNEEVTT